MKILPSLDDVKKIAKSGKYKVLPVSAQIGSGGKISFSCG